MASTLGPLIFFSCHERLNVMQLRLHNSNEFEGILPIFHTANVNMDRRMSFYAVTKTGSLHLPMENFCSTTATHWTAY